MRLRYIFLAVIFLTISWETCVEAEHSRNQNSSTYSSHGVTNQYGWRNNVTSYSNSKSRNNTTLAGNRNHNTTSTTTIRKTSAPSRNSTKPSAPHRNSSLPNRNNTHHSHGHANSTRVTKPNLGSTTPNRNSTHINHKHANSTRATPPNRGSLPPSKNSTHINHGHANNTRVSHSPNRSSSPPNRNNTKSNNTPISNTKIYPTRTTPNQNPPPVAIHVPNTTSPRKPKQPGFTESLLDALQKELTKNKTVVTTRKPKTTAKPITKTKQQIVRRPPSTTKAPPAPPYPATPLAPFRNTYNPVQIQAPQVLYLPGGPFGYYVCNSPAQQIAQSFYPVPNNNIANGTYPSGAAFPITYNATTGTYVQPGLPASQQGPGTVQPHPFYNHQNFGNAQLGTQQGYVNGQPVNTGFYVQPGLVNATQGPGYVQYPTTANGQPGAYGAQGMYPPGFIPQSLPGSNSLNSQTPQGFSNGQAISPVYPVHYGFNNATQGPGNVQPPQYTNPQYYENGHWATNGSYVANQQGSAQPALPGWNVRPDQVGAAGSHFQTGNYNSNFQAPPINYPQGFVAGQPGTPASYINPDPPIAPGTQQPYIYGPNGQICTFVYNQPGVAGIPPGFLQQPYPANVSQVVPNSQPGSYGRFSTGVNNSNSTAGQYQSYPVWPNAAYPYVQPGTFNVSQGFTYWQNIAPQMNNTSFGIPGRHH